MPTQNDEYVLEDPLDETAGMVHEPRTALTEFLWGEAKLVAAAYPPQLLEVPLRFRI
jgi:hypothetical protein